MTFGGDGLRDLYITSASVGLSQAEVQRGVRASDRFRMSAAVTGLPTHRFVVECATA